MASTSKGEGGEEEGEEEKKCGNLASANHGGLLFQECAHKERQDSSFRETYSTVRY